MKSAAIEVETNDS